METKKIGRPKSSKNKPKPVVGNVRDLIEDRKQAQFNEAANRASLVLIVGVALGFVLGHALNFWLYC